MTFRGDVDAQMHRHGIPLDMKDLRDQWDMPLEQTSLEAKTSVIVRAGVIDMRSGVSSFGVRQLMNNLACALGVYIRTNINFANIEIECSDSERRISEIVDMPTVGVNTEHLWLMEHFCDWALGRLGKPSMYYGDATASESVMKQVCEGKRRIHVTPTSGAKEATRKALTASEDDPALAERAKAHPLTLGEAHAKLDAIEGKASSYSALFSAFAGGIACACFVFLLSGGPFDMLAAFFGAGAGQFLRKKMAAKHFNEFLTVAAAVVLALLVFFATLGVASIWHSAAILHTTSYIGAILFVVPGFPLVTGGLDLAKTNVQTGIQRLTYAFTVLFIATLAAWVVAWTANLAPQAFVQPAIPPAILLILRFVCSFIAVWGFSVMFSSTPAIACTAALIGAIANTIRLEMVDTCHLPMEVAAFLAAMIAGLLASVVGTLVRRGELSVRFGFPRISLSVASVLPMVPGLYIYRAIYYFGQLSTVNALNWMFRALMVLVCLPIGLATARILSDRNWRHDL